MASIVALPNKSYPFIPHHFDPSEARARSARRSAAYVREQAAKTSVGFKSPSSVGGRTGGESIIAAQKRHGSGERAEGKLRHHVFVFGRSAKSVWKRTELLKLPLQGREREGGGRSEGSDTRLQL